MLIVVQIMLGFIAVEHLYFLYLEMFAWTKPRTRKAFGLTEEFALSSKALAANQGLYNGFLAAGCAWAICAQPDMRVQLTYFFGACVLIAGIYGGFTANKKIFVLQALPAAILLACRWLASG